jgi:hypothetical protein
VVAGRAVTTGAVRVPIGSLTSQHFANFYLGWMDRFVKEQLRELEQPGQELPVGQP